jgi:multiple sugar transport system permease protein
MANYVLKKLGLTPQLWLSSLDMVLPSLMIVDIWEWTPMIALIVLAGMTTLPQEPYESALVDGASRWQIFRLITLPLLVPTIVVAMLLRMIDALKTFDLIYATTQGGPGIASETLNIYGYVLGFGFFKMGLGSALIMLFLLLVALVSLLFVYLRKKAGELY